MSNPEVVALPARAIHQQNILAQLESMGLICFLELHYVFAQAAYDRHVESYSLRRSLYSLRHSVPRVHCIQNSYIVSLRPPIGKRGRSFPGSSRGCATRTQRRCSTSSSRRGLATAGLSLCRSLALALLPWGMRSALTQKTCVELQLHNSVECRLSVL